MGSVISKQERCSGPTQRNDCMNPNPWYPSLSQTPPQQESVSLDEPLLQGSSLHISLHPTSYNAVVNIHLANTVLGTCEKQYCHFFTIRVEQGTEIELRYTKSGRLFYTLNGAEVPVQSRGLNFHRPLYILMGLLNTTYITKSTLNVELLYVENVENYVGAPDQADVSPGQRKFKCTYEIMELLLNKHTQKAFIDEPLVPGTKYYLSASCLDTNLGYVNVYLTNSSPQELNQGEITLMPISMTDKWERCKIRTVVKLRFTWTGELAGGRDGEKLFYLESGGIHLWLDIEKPVYVFVEFFNMEVKVTRMDDRDAGDEKITILSGHLGGGESTPLCHRSVHGQPPPLDRDRPRIRLLPNEGRNRPQETRRPLPSQRNA